MAITWPASDIHPIRRLFQATSTLQATTERMLIQLAGEKGSAAQLARVLRPIMWRNSKRSSAGLGLELPPRTLTLTRLHFTPAEHTFYSHILEKTREARDALHHHEHQSNADSAGPSTASPNQSGKCASILLRHMHVIRVEVNMKSPVLCCAVLCCAVLCCAVLCQIRLSQLGWAQASLHTALNFFMTLSLRLQKLTSVTGLGTSATCPMLHHVLIPYALAPPFVKLASGQDRSWQKQGCCCAEPPQGTPVHLTLSFSSINANRRDLGCLCLLCRAATGVSSQPGSQAV